MPTCRKCHKDFPNRMKINGKFRNLQNRWYCIECSPFGQRNTQKLEKPKNRDCICKICKRSYVYSKRKGHQYHKCNSCVALENKKKKKQKAVEYKGGACFICNYNKCNDALDFHHVNPKEKSFLISHNYNRAWNILEKELDKCVLLCCRCHKEIHAKLIKLDD